MPLFFIAGSIYYRILFLKNVFEVICSSQNDSIRIPSYNFDILIQLCIYTFFQKLWKVFETYIGMQVTSKFLVCYLCICNSEMADVGIGNP